MALIEHLERDGWEEFFRGIFQYTLEVMKHDRFRSVGSPADDLRSWLARGGVSRIRERLDDQMEMRRFSPSRRAAVRDCLEQLVRENRRALLDLTTTGVIPASGQVRTEAVGVSETDVRDLLNRMIAGQRPFEDWMHAHGRSDEEIAEIYQLIDEWLMQKGIIPPPPSAPGLNWSAAMRACQPAPPLRSR